MTFLVLKQKPIVWDHPVSRPVFVCTRVCLYLCAHRLLYTRAWVCVRARANTFCTRILRWRAWLFPVQTRIGTEDGGVDKYYPDGSNDKIPSSLFVRGTCVAHTCNTWCRPSYRRGSGRRVTLLPRRNARFFTVKVFFTSCEVRKYLRHKSVLRRTLVLSLLRYPTT